jgi:hypothetical protein
LQSFDPGKDYAGLRDECKTLSCCIVVDDSLCHGLGRDRWLGFSRLAGLGSYLPLVRARMIGPLRAGYVLHEREALAGM